MKTFELESDSVFKSFDKLVIKNSFRIEIFLILVFLLIRNVKARDTPIGDDKIRGVSGGERKRVSVAVQLISGTISLL